MYLGGKALDNSGGNIIDFVYQNKMTRNVALVEIKTPSTELLGSLYRGHSYSLSKELSGSVNQVLSYKQSLLMEFATLRNNSQEPIEAFLPQCIVLIGQTRELADASGCYDRNKLSAFENFRNNLNGVTIITYDEMLHKLKDWINVLKTGASETP